MLRKFICLSAGLAACGIVGTAEAGPKVLQKTNDLVRKDPIRIARVFADGSVGEWVPYVSADDGACYGPGYDAFEAVRADSNDPCGEGKGFPVDGACAGGFDPFCDLPGGGDCCAATGWRWFYNFAYVQGGRRSSGITASSHPGTSTANVCRMQISWAESLAAGSLDPNGNTVGNTVIVVSTFDGQFDQLCGTDEPNFLTGVALDFGPSAFESVWYSDIDLTGGFELDLPSGDHGNEVLFFYDTGLQQPAANNQTMLWSPKDASEQGQPAAIVYDDDDWNHTFDPFAECFDYSGEVPCPDPAQSQVVFYTEGDPPCQSFSVDRLIGGSPSTFSVESPDNGGASFGVIYFLNEAQGLAFADCVNNASSNSLGELVSCYGGDPRDTLACQGSLNASGNGSCTVPVPRQASGRTVTFVSVVQTADGWCAEAFTQTIL